MNAPTLNFPKQYPLRLRSCEVVPKDVQFGYGFCHQSRATYGTAESVTAMTGAQLRWCRKRTGLSIAEFAGECGLTRVDSIREMELGSRPITGPIARCAMVMAGIWPFQDVHFEEVYYLANPPQCLPENEARLRDLIAANDGN